MLFSNKTDFAYLSVMQIAETKKLNNFSKKGGK